MKNSEIIQREMTIQSKSERAEIFEFLMGKARLKRQKNEKFGDYPTRNEDHS